MCFFFIFLDLFKRHQSYFSVINWAKLQIQICTVKCQEQGVHISEMHLWSAFAAKDFWKGKLANCEVLDFMVKKFSSSSFLCNTYVRTYQNVIYSESLCISCTDHCDWLTHSSKLRISYFSCLTVLYSIP